MEIKQKWRVQHQVALALALDRPGGEDLFAYITPFPSEETHRDMPKQPHFPILELRLIEARPGGFSPEGLRTYQELMSFLRQEGYRLVVIAEPPPTDSVEYARVKSGMFGAAASVWLLAWVCGSVTIGALANWLAARMGAQQWARRAIFVMVGVVLVTPFEYPMALASVLFPGLLWLLSDPATYVSFMFEFAASAMVSGALSAVAAGLLICDRKNISRSEERPVN